MHGPAAAQSKNKKPPLEPRATPADNEQEDSQKTKAQETDGETPPDNKKGEKAVTSVEGQPLLDGSPPIPKGFVAADVKADAPEDIKAFFVASDKARLAAIDAHRQRIAAIKRRQKAASGRQPIKPEELEEAADSADYSLGSRGASITALMKDVGYVAPFESIPQSGESKVLRDGLVLHFSRPIRVVRVLDKERVVIQVEEQIPGQSRRNSEGRLIEPITLRRVKAVVRTSTSSLEDGMRTLIKEPLRVTGTEEFEGAKVFVLEPFSAAEFLNAPEKTSGEKTGGNKSDDDKEGDDKTVAEKLAAKNAGPLLPKGFIVAKVKADAPDEIKAFFAASDKARLAAIAGHRQGMAATERRLKAAADRQKLKPEDLEDATDSADYSSGSRGASIAALMIDVGYVPPFETIPQSGESKVLKDGLVLRFGKPIRVVRVLDDERVVIQVDEQIHAPKRPNSEGRLIEPITVQRAKAVVRISTSSMKDGARALIKEPLRVTGTDEFNGAKVFVLEPFLAAEFLDAE
jgi:hypothetical protein